MNRFEKKEEFIESPSHFYSDYFKERSTHLSLGHKDKQLLKEFLNQSLRKKTMKSKS